MTEMVTLMHIFVKKDRRGRSVMATVACLWEFFLELLRSCFVFFLILCGDEGGDDGCF